MLARRVLVVAGLSVLVAAGVAPAARAQLPNYGLGRTPTAEEIRAWDVTIPPDGKGLPPGRGTATEGESVYTARCEACHGKKGQSPKYDPAATQRTLAICDYWEKRLAEIA